MKRLMPQSFENWFVGIWEDYQERCTYTKSGAVADPAYYSLYAMRNMKSMSDRQNSYIVAAFAQSSNTVSPYAERIVLSGNDFVSTQREPVDTIEWRSC